MVERILNEQDWSTLGRCFWGICLVRRLWEGLKNKGQVSWWRELDKSLCVLAVSIQFSHCVPRLLVGHHTSHHVVLKGEA